VKFNDLAWAAVCFYYRSTGDKRYCATMRDTDFLTRLRNSPQDLRLIEFEEKAILGFINLENYDLLVAHRLAEKVLSKIIGLKGELDLIKGHTLLETDLRSPRVSEAISNVYAELRAYGLWITGASKICHLLNEHLFPLLSPDLIRHFNITEENSSLLNWLLKVQEDVHEVAADFQRQGLPGTPEQFLSEHIGYVADGCSKSLVKLADEYYWLRYGDGLPVPPKWAPNLLQAR
jgi:hypothetical protein